MRAHATTTSLLLMMFLLFFFFFSKEEHTAVLFRVRAILEIYDDIALFRRC